MNRIAIGLALVLTLWTGAAAADMPPQKKVVLTVRGMVCGSCATAVEKALNKMDGVVQAKVDLKKDMATVRYDERRVTPLKMTEALATLGYQAQQEAR